MKAIKKTNFLAKGLKDFFSDYLPKLRGLSHNTTHSYRDSLVLLLRFIAAQQKRQVAELDIQDVKVEQVIAFLQMLEEERNNRTSTRNIRLAAIHSFFRYLASHHPEKIEYCQRILAIPFKRDRSRVVEYLEYKEIEAVLATINRSTLDGNRDYALLATMFNTGARVQEILNLRIRDLQLAKPYQLRLIGKGNKERLCPIWEKTAELLKSLLAAYGDLQPNDHVFLNHRKEPLTRFGVRYLLLKYCNLAKNNVSTLINKRLHPHSMRHSTAVHLLKSGVDIVTISQWLGHANINMTNRYASIDLDIKRNAIDKAAIKKQSLELVSWHSDTSILTWLESL